MKKDTTVAKQEENSTDSSVANREESTTSDEKHEPTFAEAMAAVAAKAQDSKPEGETDDDEDSGDEEDSSTSDSEVSKRNTTEGEEDKTEEGKEDTSKVDASKDEKLPFHDHPRWKEVVGENQQLKAQKPLIEQAQQLNSFCEQNRITPEELNNSLEFMRLFKTDPEAARKMLEPTWKSLEGYVGNELPADLQAKVVEGKMEEADARELARLRAQNTTIKNGNANNAQWQAQQAVKQTVEAMNQWDMSRRGTDPAFKPKGDASLPDGKWELVNMKVASLIQATPPKTQAEAIALLEKAYTEIGKTYSQFMPARRKTAPNLNSNGSSNTTREVWKPKTFADVIKGAAEGRKQTYA